MLRKLPETVLPKESKKLKKYKKATGNYTLQHFPAVISSFSI
ncbi:hypothetical protein [Blautia wexlerae]|nr:hypothetical protein [Blautia wexlerae]UWO22469.1 hypothetical protein NQ550_09405 [Blautia wexlerae DSM 19850]